MDDSLAGLVEMLLQPRLYIRPVPLQSFAEIIQTAHQVVFYRLQHHPPMILAQRVAGNLASSYV